ncbi:enoyl-CoA delta isomerase 2 [Epargyreus clarus]|uniref:enoyl-CoA delta isomerase 2 n=1 Tax=Epargyreus clarus TaxID=520877 RepID=UPI003C30362E
MDVSDSNIIETVNGNVKTIRFNKPRRKNAISIDMYRRVTQILKDASTDENIFMVVLTGTGDFYSSGNDLVEAATHTDENGFLHILEEFIKAFILFPKLLIAIVNGPAVGVATTTLPLCDLVFASDKAYFYTPFTKLGIIAEACSTLTFPSQIGKTKSIELLLLNYKMPAKEALECGLINYMHTPEELEEKAWEKINEILKLPLEPVLVTKKLFRRTLLDELLKTNEIEIAEIKKIRANLKSKL